MKILRKTLMGLAVTLIAATCFVVTADTAAAAGCYGASCKGRDPQMMGCWRDAKTVGISPHPGTAGAGWQEFVELRYSKACGTQWSRVTNRLETKDTSYTTAYIFDNPSLTRVTRYGAAGKLVWSRMWPATTAIGKACGNSVSKSDPTYKPEHCAIPDGS